MAVLVTQWSRLARVVLLLTSSLHLILWSIRCEGRVGGLFGSAGQGVTKSIRAAGSTSSLIRNAGGKEVWRYLTIKNLLSNVQVMLGQTVCAAYIHMYKV
eukprot:1156712-Pelagomonas_calceolata.AAC.4